MSQGIIAGKNELTRVINFVNEMKTKQVIHSKLCKTGNNLRQMFFKSMLRSIIYNTFGHFHFEIN